MLRLYSPILLLQVFCLYHAYSNAKEHKWYFVIVFLPVIGSIIYFYVHFVTQQNIDVISDTVQDAFSTDPKIEKLKKELIFADTINNRINLADEYLNRGLSKLALEHYDKCLEGPYRDDAAILIKSLEANFLEKNFDEAITLGKKLTGDPLFKKSKERVSFALSLQHLNEIALADEEFQNMDIQYSNYFQRLAYSKFLHSIGKEEESRSKLDELITEINQMGRTEKRFNSEIFGAIKQARKTGWKE